MAPAFNAESNSNAGASWQYIGLPTGVTRLYPATLQKTCYTYDPRLRPWYVAATSGPKDVVIVIDVSGSMGANNRTNITKTAVKSVLTTLTINDYVSILTFQSSSKQLCGTKSVTIDSNPSKNVSIPCGTLVQATALNIGALELFVDGMVLGGGTPVTIPPTYSPPGASKCFSKSRFRGFVFDSKFILDNCMYAFYFF